MDRHIFFSPTWCQRSALIVWGTAHCNPAAARLEQDDKHGGAGRIIGTHGDNELERRALGAERSYSGPGCRKRRDLREGGRGIEGDLLIVSRIDSSRQTVVDWSKVSLAQNEMPPGLPIIGGRLGLNGKRDHERVEPEHSIDGRSSVYSGYVSLLISARHLLTAT
ncbi:hypothetical protein BDW69DRAFT_146914 [Aspergillus filifer]